MSSPNPPIITSPIAPDIGDVKAWIEKMVKALKFVELVSAIVYLVTRMRDINTELMRQVANLRRGRPRSETLRRVEEQQVFAFMGERPKMHGPKRPPKSRKGKHPGRAALPAHLPRVKVVNQVSPEKRICDRCGREMTVVGHEVCSILEIQPARLYVIERLDERVACPHDDNIVSAETPPQIVERGKLGDTLIVEATADKYMEHQPIERQSRRFARAGVEVSPNTLGRSVAAAIDLLSPVARAIHDNTRASTLLAADATGLPVLDEDHPLGIRNGTMWCWVGDHRWVSFFYAALGDSTSVKNFLGNNHCRTVQCDGTSIMSFIERAGGKRPGCMSHGRRRFIACARSGDALAFVPLKILRRLFAVERLSSLHGESAEQRLARRLKDSAPVVEELRRWLDEHRAIIPPKTPLGKAIGYLHRQWERLTLFLTNGDIELTNNRVERELRPLVLGRKNWLFAFGDLGGERTAAILTIVGTCVAQRINPRAYLHVVTRLLVHGWPKSRLRELLPDRVGELHPELRLPPRSPRSLTPLSAAPS